MKGYKAFDKDLKCRDFYFKVGGTFTNNKDISICSSGFHFCQKLENIYNYYPKSSDTRVCEVEALSEVLTEGDKSVTKTLKIVRELTQKGILDFWINRTNSGDWNSGYGNSGNRNSGDGNSGNRNSGNRNSGDWNSGDGNSGYFNTKIPVYFFNKPSETPYTKELENKLRSINVKPIVTYIDSLNMTDLEKTENPSHLVTGGFLRKTERFDWSRLEEKDKCLIRSLPNFDNEIFKKISNGISLIE